MALPSATPAPAAMPFAIYYRDFCSAIALSSLMAMRRMLDLEKSFATPFALRVLFSRYHMPPIEIMLQGFHACNLPIWWHFDFFSFSSLIITEIWYLHLKSVDTRISNTALDIVYALYSLSIEPFNWQIIYYIRREESVAFDVYRDEEAAGGRKCHSCLILQITAMIDVGFRWRQRPQSD